MSTDVPHTQTSSVALPFCHTCVQWISTDQDAVCNGNNIDNNNDDDNNDDSNDDNNDNYTDKIMY